MQMPIFWLVSLILSCLWLGGAGVLAALTHIESKEQDVHYILRTFRGRLTIPEAILAQGEKAPIVIVFWMIYPLILTFAWATSLIEAAKAQADKEREKMYETAGAGK